MRIWVGVHPGELDPERLKVLHDDMHTALSEIEQWYASQCFAGYPGSHHELPAEIAAWAVGPGVACLVYLHNLIEYQMFPLFKIRPYEDTPLKLSDGMLSINEAGQEVVRKLYNKEGTTPQSWPPSFVDTTFRLADLKDLQARWRREGRTKEFRRSVERYSLWQGGTLEGAFKPEDVTEAEVNIYRRYRKDRAARLKNGNQGISKDWRCTNCGSVSVSSGVRSDGTCGMCGRKLVPK